jgi:hypothetical protein
VLLQAFRPPVKSCAIETSILSTFVPLHADMSALLFRVAGMGLVGAVSLLPMVLSM